MGKNDLDIATEDEALCARLHKEGNCPRWVIITAFYAALRYVNHYIFPCSITEEDGQVGLANDLDEYYTLVDIDSAKHVTRQKLLRSKLKEDGHTSRVARKYRALQDASENARYGTKDVQNIDANYAWNRLCDIKKFCLSGEDQPLSEDEDNEAVPVEAPKARKKR